MKSSEARETWTSSPENGDAVVALNTESPLSRILAPWRWVAERQRRVKGLLMATDLAVMFFCFAAGRLPFWIRDDIGLAQAMNVWWHAQGQRRITLFLTVALIMVAWMGAVQGHYTAARRKPWWDETREVLLVVFSAAVVDAMLIFFGKWDLSRLWTGVSWALILVLLPLSRLFVRRQLLKAGLLAQPYVLIGQAGDAEMAAAALASEPLMGYSPVALIHPRPAQTSVSMAGQLVETVALTPAVRRFLARPGSYQIVVVLGEDNSWQRELTQELMLTRDDVIIIPALNGLPMHGMETAHFFSHEVLLLRARNNLNRRAPKALKRLIDVVGALLLGVLLAPFLAVVAYLIWREDRGPVFFVQQRIGKNGKPFRFIKFRSMVTRADEALEHWKDSNPDLWEEYRASNFKLLDDPRVTRIGQWIRRTSVDELPQLLNVLRGDMSLVGPRPLLARELGDYGPAIAAYGKARPGITGLWQISGRSASTFQHRIAMDLWYVRNWSLWYDLVIMLRTVRVVLRQEGAC